MRTWIAAGIIFVVVGSIGFVNADSADELVLLKKASAAAKTVAAKKEIVLSAMKLAADAATAGDYDTAKASSLLAVGAARPTRDASLLQRAMQQQSKHNELVRQWKDVEKAKLELRADPENPKANEIVGRFIALSLQKWDEGIPHLAKGTDQKLRDAAAADQKTPEEAGEQDKVANLWWTAGSPEAKKDRGPILARSAYWYELAIPELTGVAKELAEKRLQECYEVMNGWGFKKILAQPPNGFQSIGTIDCKDQSQPAVIADSFNIRGSWLLNLEFNSSDFPDGEHIMFGWGDIRGSRNPIVIRLDGTTLACGTTDCEINVEQKLLRLRIDENSGKWVNMKFIHDAVEGELELYVNGKLESKKLLTIGPYADRKMTAQIGGIPGHNNLRYYGQVRSVWLGNIK